MPQAEHLPVDLKELAFRNAVELTHARWKSDVALLIHALRPYMDPIEAIHAVANGGPQRLDPATRSKQSLPHVQPPEPASVGSACSCHHDQ